MNYAKLRRDKALFFSALIVSFFRYPLSYKSAFSREW